MTERRFLPSEPPVATGRTISGHAARFNTRSENLGSDDRPLYEIIMPGAFDDVLNDDVIAAFNHDESKVLARSTNGKGSLKLTIDDIGLKYEFEAPDSTLGNDLLESIRRKDIRASSFAFSVAENGDAFTTESDGATLRTITKIGRLYDVSPVTRPAYPAATVSARSLPANSTPRANGWKRLFEILK